MSMSKASVLAAVMTCLPLALSASAGGLATAPFSADRGAGATVPVAAGPAWHGWSPEVFARAQQQGRLVLIDLTAEWCQFCRKMDQATWRNVEVLAEIQRHFIPVRVDWDRETALRARFGNYGVPAVVILAGDGEELVRKRGYLKPQWMLWLLQAVVESQGPGEGGEPASGGAAAEAGDPGPEAVS